ncbi:MAG: glycosyltransferase family 2 protein [Thermodesulfobacteriota bacterium]
MPSKLPLTVVILTFNEELNIEKCLNSVADYVNGIFIVDSYSTDKTLEIAKNFENVVIFQNKFETHSKQWLWALKNLPIKNDWIFGLDCDQTVTNKLWIELIDLFKNGVDNFDGLYIKRKYIFMGKWIKYGGFYPKYLLKIFRKNKVIVDSNELVDHHFFINGTTKLLENDIIEENYNENNLSFWTYKHIKYAERFAVEFSKKNEHNNKLSLDGTPDQKIITNKTIFYKLPAFLRPFLYFIYRYFIRLGFLDGRQGLIFHFLHALWFRFLVDAKIFELKNNEKS